MFEILLKCPLFQGVSLERIKELIGGYQQYDVNSYKYGDLIAKRDSAYSGLMIVLDGRVCGELGYRNDRNLIVDTLEPANLIAPAFLFGGYNRLPVNIIAKSDDVRILTLHRGLIFEIIQEDMVVLSNFIDIISNRANVWSKKIYILSMRTLEVKFALYLMDQGSDRVSVPGVAQIAEFFGSTRSSIQTVMENMEKRGIIECKGEWITILNRKVLSEIVEFN